jgi:hypothetical protein
MNGELGSFWQDYPEGSLTSEFIGFECGKYIVSARASSDRGKIIASSLAAAETIESAEESARQRLLAIVATRTSIAAISVEVSKDGGKKVAMDRSNGFSELSKSGDSIGNLANTSDIVASVGSEDISATTTIASKPPEKSLVKKGIVKEETSATIEPVIEAEVPVIATAIEEVSPPETSDATPTVLESMPFESLTEDVSPAVTPTEAIETEIETAAEVTPEKSGRSSPRKSKKAAALANDTKIEEVPLTTNTFDLPRSSDNPVEVESASLSPSEEIDSLPPAEESESSFTPPPSIDSLPPLEESEPSSPPVDSSSSIEEESSFTPPPSIDSLPPVEETESFSPSVDTDNFVEAESESSFTPPPPVDSLPPLEESESFSPPVDSSSIEEESSFTPPPPVDSLPPVEESKSTSSPPPAEEAAGSGSPVNFGEIIPRLKVELIRLGWDRDRGRDFLMERYNKRSSTLLTPDQLVDFLSYLESQPNPDLPL